VKERWNLPNGVFGFIIPPLCERGNKWFMWKRNYCCNSFYWNNFPNWL